MRYSWLEKFGLAVLIVIWLIYGANFVGDMLVKEPEVIATAAERAAPEEGKAPETTAAKEPAAEETGGAEDIGQLLASADAARGEKVFGKCKSCHTVNEGGKNRVGPNLWGVVGRPKASIPGFAYSEALRKLGGEWTYAALFQFLAKPKAYAPGTKMSFAGLKKPEDQAAVIMFLRQHSTTPPPLP